MKRGPNRHTRASHALTDALVENRKLTLQEATLIQSSDLARFNIVDWKMVYLSPEELINQEYQNINGSHGRNHPSFKFKLEEYNERHNVV